MLLREKLRKVDKVNNRDICGKSGEDCVKLHREEEEEEEEFQKKRQEEILMLIIREHSSKILKSSPNILTYCFKMASVCL